MAEKRATLLIELKDMATAGLEKLKATTKGLTDVYSGLKLGLEAARQTFGRVIDVVEESLKAFGEHELVVNRLTQALKNQGFYSKEYAENLDALANSLKLHTVQSKDAILETMTLLTTFGLAGTELQKATQAALNMENRVGSLRTATMLLGKAWEGHTEALRRFGIQVDNNLGPTEKFQATLEQINKNFGNQAQVEADGYLGKLQLLKNRMTEISEVVGSFVIKYGGIGAILNGLNAAAGKVLGAIAPEAASAGPLGGPGSKTDPEAQYQENLKAQQKIVQLLKGTSGVFANKQKIAEAEIRLEETKNAKIFGANKAATMANIALKRLEFENFQQTLGFISSLSTAKNKELAAIGKAASIATATIKTYEAANVALASTPYPYNFIAAGLTTVAGLANVATIAGVQMAQGGMVMPTSGGTLATIGEAGSREAVIPLDDPKTKNALRDTLGGGITLQVGTLIADKSGMEEFARELDKVFWRLKKNNQTVAI